MSDSSGVLFKKGSQVCGTCKTKDDIIQFEYDNVRGDLPVTEIAFFCKNCSTKLGLMK